MVFATAENRILINKEINSTFDTAKYEHRILAEWWTLMEGSANMIRINIELINPMYLINRKAISIFYKAKLLSKHGVQTLFEKAVWSNLSSDHKVLSVCV